MGQHFEVKVKDKETSARHAVLKTRHGAIETPVFMPVGTQATVKALTPHQVKECGAQIILGNTYHLNLRPGSELVRDFGGLHSFMSWDGPILTDSGGFQVFSLAKLRKITDEGIAFQSHIDGKKLFLDPLSCFQIQENLATDIAMVLDECPPWPCEEKDCEVAVGRTIRWAQQFKDHATNSGFLESGHHVFGIVQGSMYAHLRTRCAEALVDVDFPGYAIGGVSVGEPEEAMLEQTGVTVPSLPEDKPRYVMGVGTPPQLLKMVAQGCDMFDCVMPTRLARHATVFTDKGTLNLKNEKFKFDQRPIMEGMDNYTCQHFSRGYLRHLIMANELLAHTLLSLHNVHFFLKLMDDARSHIKAGDFKQWSENWIKAYQSNSPDFNPDYA